MLPITVLMIPFYYMENAMGLIDTRTGLALAHLAVCLPLVIWICKGYFKGIPREIEEAALIDGCGTWQRLTKIVLPLLRPAIASTGIYGFISSWNEFALANVLSRSDKSRTIPIALNEFSSFFRVDWGDTMAAAVLITLPILILFWIIQKQFIEGIASGAVKG
jgi:ABC-type glycerol-3-phosphate transport system permease component